MEIKVTSTKFDDIELIYFILYHRILKIRLPLLEKLYAAASAFRNIQNLDFTEIRQTLYPGSLGIDAISKDIIEKITDPNKNIEYFKQIKQMLKKCRDSNIQIYSRYSEDYPKGLIPIQNIIDIIFVKGTILEQDLQSVSIIGSRNGSAWGLMQSRRIGKIFANNGFTIINGFARGVDIHAIHGALEVGGRCIGVLGSGVDTVYPEEHSEIAIDVIRNGALISQRFLGERVTKQSLQIRNQLSSALALGNIFIEGSHSSGTKWQYKFSREQGKSNYYLNPIDPSRECAQVPLLVKNEMGLQIDSNLNNIKQVIADFKNYYSNRFQL